LKFDKGGILLWPTLVPLLIQVSFLTHKDTMAKRKTYHFWHVTQGMNVVNAIAKDDVITKVTITRKALWQKV
jgi:hypothetical protein